MSDVSITLTVPQKTAALLQQAPAELQRDVALLIDAFLSDPKTLDRSRYAERTLRTRAALADEAKARGLTPEVLESLLEGTEAVFPEVSFEVCRDPKDDQFLEL